MKPLLEVLAGIEAFKKDMEDLGVDVDVSATGVSENWGKGPSVTVISLVLKDLEEDLEAEG